MRHIPLPILTPDNVSRFWSKVKIGLENECWEWTAGLFDKRYGQFKINGQSYIASRISYFISTGNDPNHLDILHECDNTKYVNPNHLWPGTNQDNMTDCSIKGRLKPASNTRLYPSDIQKIFDLRSKGMTLKEIGKIFNICYQSVHNILIRKSYKDVIIKEI